MTGKAEEKQPAGRTLRNFLIDELRKAKEALENDSGHSLPGIHLARKRLKRVRAVLELLREESPYVYQVEKQAFRDISKSLARYRDDDAMIETLDRILEGYPDSLPIPVHKSLGQSFARHRDAAIASRGVGCDDIVSAARALDAASQRMQLLPLANVSTKTLLAARSRSLRRMRRARNKALGSHEPTLFHRWRKRTKMLLYQEQFLKRLGRSKKRTRRRLEKLGEILGCANDAAVLNAYLGKQPDSLQIDQNIRIMQSLAQDQELKLHSKALAETVRKLH